MPTIDMNNIPTTRSAMMNHDHKEFVEILNTLLTLLDDNSEPNSITNELASLQTHTQKHFAREEELMLKANFPPYPVHKSEHERVLFLLKEAIANWGADHDKKKLTALLQDQLPEWLVQHVASMDMVTSQFLENTGNL